MTITKLRPPGWPILRGVVERAAIRAAELPHRFSSARPGTAEWLVAAEVKYGGMVSNVPRRIVSPADERSTEALAVGGMTGGDRMLHHGYATTYSKYLGGLGKNPPSTLVEVGILKGSGLAIWCDLFPDTRVIGLDIDLSHYRSNLPYLRRRGAFRRNQPEAHVFDQLEGTPDQIGRLLAGAKIDIVIDDGLHNEKSIDNTFRCIAPYLADKFIYFIEDCPMVLERVASATTPHDVEQFGELFVVSRGV